MHKFSMIYLIPEQILYFIYLQTFKTFPVTCKFDLVVCSSASQMSNITVTYRDGRVAQLEQVYIRGSKIRFLILPDMLKNAPMLKSMKNKNQGSGAGRGKAAILKAQGG